jgi:hypothetical protein
LLSEGGVMRKWKMSVSMRFITSSSTCKQHRHTSDWHCR